MDLIKKYLEEQETIDTGWKKAQTDRKDEYGNRIKNVARRLARQGMQAAMKDLKKGPEAGKRQVEEVELDEALNYELKDAPNGGSHVMMNNKRVGTVHAPVDGIIHGTHISGDGSKAPVRGRPGAKIFTPSKDKDSMAKKIAQYHQRHFTPRVPKRTDEEVELEENLNNKLSSLNTTVNKIIKSKESRKSYLQNVASGKSGSFIHQDTAKKLLNKPTKEEVELDELQEPTVQKYITRAKFSSNPKRRAMAQKAQFKLQQKPKPMKTEEVELDEAKLNIDQQIANHEKASDIHYNRYKRAAHRPSGSGSIHSFDAPRDPSTAEAAHYNLYAHHDEAAKHLKAYKETGFKKHLNAYNSSHKHIQSLYKQHRFTAKQANEEVELDESLKKKLAAMGVAATMAASPAAARVTDGGQSFAQQTAQQSSQHQSVKTPKEIPSKSYLQNVASGKSRSLMHPDTAKELLKKHYSEEVEHIDEISAGLASAVARARDDSFRKNEPTETQKRRMARGSWRGLPDVNAYRTYKSAIHRGAKDVYKEEIDLVSKYLKVDEAIEDRILDKGHSRERLQKTLDKAREHEKSYFKKRADSFFKPTDYDSRYKEDKRLQKVRKVASAAGTAIKYHGQKPTENPTRTHPIGSRFD